MQLALSSCNWGPNCMLDALKLLKNWFLSFTIVRQHCSLERPGLIQNIVCFCTYIPCNKFVRNLHPAITYLIDVVKLFTVCGCCKRGVSIAVSCIVKYHVSWQFKFRWSWEAPPSLFHLITNIMLRFIYMIWFILFY